MRAGYSVKRIKDICDKGSSNVAQKELEGHDGEYPIFGASGFIKNVDFFHQDREYVGIVKDGSGIGRVSFYPPKSSLIGTLQYIFPKAEYDIRYVGYCLQSLNLASYRQGAAIPHIYFRDYGEREVLVADSITEQQRIVDILDQEFAKIDALKANAEKSLQAAKDLFQATLKKELEPKEGWCRTTIGALCEDVKYGTSKPSSASGHYTYLRMNNITNDGYLSLADTKRIDINEDEEPKYLVQKGDILFNRTNSRELVGKTCVFQEEEPMVIAGYIIRVRVKDDVNPHFVSFYLNHQPIRERLRALSTGAVHQSNINAKVLQSFEICLPNNRSEQDKLVCALSTAYSKVSALQDNYQKTLTLCDDLKQALLRKAFNGEL